MPQNNELAIKLLGMLFKPHPWHGIAPGDRLPDLLNAYIEIVPGDTVKYEIDKPTGYLRVDRPQRYSSLSPTLYGFIPQTWCGRRTGELCAERTGRRNIIGDGDPLDICVLTEHAIAHGDVLLKVVPIGGLRMIDGNEADDKIIAVLRDDVLHGNWRDITECPQNLVDRLRHYFLTYKQIPGVERAHVEITHVYDREEAARVIQASIADYLEEYGDPQTRMKELKEALGLPNG
ncbi:MAG: inorganic pyrophosphatase [Myxococcales bacterium]